MAFITPPSSPSYEFDRGAEDSEYCSHSSSSSDSFSDDDLQGSESTDDNVPLSGTHAFIEKLLTRQYPSGDAILRVASGYEINSDYFDQHGFESPILIPSIRGLNLTLPSDGITIDDVLRLVGSDVMVSVINVIEQEDEQMTLGEFVRYFKGFRMKTLNLLSLEFSQYPLSRVVGPPAIVKEISWTCNAWPEQTPESVISRPNVARYCLISPEGAYTDFHVDFGGTAVWYHIVKGAKLFFLIPPTTANLSTYEQWIRLPNRREIMFSSLVSKCYKCQIKAGQTVFLPTGWIHAVYTMEDSLVFGGNFLHWYSVDRVISVYELERRTNTPEKYLFPHLELSCCYAARRLVVEATAVLATGGCILPHLIAAARALLNSIPKWLRRDDTLKEKLKLGPEPVNHSKLVSSLSKLLKRIDADEASQIEKESAPLKIKIKVPPPSHITEERKTVKPLKIKLNSAKDSPQSKKAKSEFTQKKVTPIKIRLPTNPNIDEDALLNDISHKDSEFVYPLLEHESAPDIKDKAYNPGSKIRGLKPREKQPKRNKAKKIIPELGIAIKSEEAKIIPPPKKEKPVVIPKEESTIEKSTVLPTAKSSSSVMVTKCKKPRKGMATVKQRLSKKLKMGTGHLPYV